MKIDVKEFGRMLNILYFNGFISEKENKNIERKIVAYYKQRKLNK